jgi:hypothetical protein
VEVKRSRRDALEGNRHGAVLLMLLRASNFNECTKTSHAQLGLAIEGAHINAR